MSVNWNRYRELFPKRYIQEGYFDERLRDTIKRIQPKTALDIGGGIGTKALQEAGIWTTLLDPYVSKPSWVSDHIVWEDLLPYRKYDLVVMRGSINYLSSKQIQAAIDALVVNGVLIANTFGKPKSHSKKQYETIDGVKGTEEVKCEYNKVYHKIIIGKEIVEHSFHYYLASDWAKIFGSGLQKIYYGNNSTLLYYIRPNNK